MIELRIKLVDLYRNRTITFFLIHFDVTTTLYFRHSLFVWRKGIKMDVKIGQTCLPMSLACYKDC